MSISNLFSDNSYSIITNNLNFHDMITLTNIPVTGSVSGNIDIVFSRINSDLAIINTSALTPSTGISATRISTASNVIPTTFRPPNDYYTPVTVINNNLKLIGQLRIASDGTLEWYYVTFTGSSTGFPKTCVTYPLT